MLATRIVTAAILIPLIVAGVLLLPTWCVSVIFAATLAIGAWEWARLLGWSARRERAIFTACYIMLAAVFGWLEHGTHGVGPTTMWLVGIAGAGWVAVVYWLVRFPSGWATGIGRRGVGAIVGVVVLCATTTAVSAIHAQVQGAWLLLVFFALVWGADSGAYFAGRGLGRHKLAPAISPGKTREGVVGGIVAALIVACASAYLLGYDGYRFAGFMLLGAWIGIISVVGDLTLSMYKRQAGLKDTGTLFPGHGGVLDRLDSMLAAAPWFVIGLLVLTRG